MGTQVQVGMAASQLLLPGTLSLGAASPAWSSCFCSTGTQKHSLLLQALASTTSQGSFLGSLLYYRCYSYAREGSQQKGGLGTVWSVHTNSGPAISYLCSLPSLGLSYSIQCEMASS